MVQKINQNAEENFLSDFFLELSSPIRLEILQILSENIEYRNSALAKMMNISAQECLRHMSRLLESNLIEQNGRYYRISPIGTLLLEGFIPQISFLLENMKFFNNHDLTVLPPAFTKRFSEIADKNTTAIIKGPSEIIALAEQIIDSADRYCYDIAKLITRSTNQMMAQKDSQSIKIKRIEEKGTSRPKNIPDLLTGETRVIEHIDIAMVVSEKEAYIRFPEKMTGDVSLNEALYSTNKNFLNFAKDLFFYFWEQSIEKTE